jgi:hypothetical protein
MKTTYGFSRRGPDRVAEELANVLSAPVSYEFKALFTVVFANLRARNAANGGEEMLRLRAYEKLQNLVQAGVIKRVGKEYQGVGPALANFLATAAELNAKFAAGIHNRPPSAPAAEVVTKSPAVAVATKSPTVAVVTKSATAKPVRRRTPASRPS